MCNSEFYKRDLFSVHASSFSFMQKEKSRRETGDGHYKNGYWSERQMKARKNG